ncbi:MAG: hypothetical protein ACKO96_40740, partial [Flammeovirgaceae bacterium]
GGYAGIANHPHVSESFETHKQVMMGKITPRKVLPNLKRRPGIMAKGRHGPGLGPIAIADKEHGPRTSKTTNEKYNTHTNTSKAKSITEEKHK